MRIQGEFGVHAEESARLISEIASSGHDLFLFSDDDLTVRLDTSELLFRGTSFPQVDVILTRSVQHVDPRMRMLLLDQCAKKGIPVVNGSLGTLDTKNKAYASVQLAAAGLPMPHTAVVYHERDADRLAEAWGYPVVVKVPYGSWGTGVFLAESSASLRPIMDFLRRRSVGNDPVIVQECITESKGVDRRLFVIGERVVASMERRGVAEDFRSNYHLGAEVFPYTPTQEEQDLAIRSAKALRIDIAGVDIIPSSRGPLLLEVNANPGFSGLEKATGVNVAKNIVSYLEAQARRN